ncbi:hypothetical protein EDD90_3291 [Streptomyces sp. Ag109_O5-1]|uniref:hypothetical protein n=1 Tax=Streptomyces sp. Ag109_O5-1 TaxID=1938851 RepID=UPI000F50513F|nr:hypothetical protein [Streptomyces sp. Ag109_O5-1]RPE40255.1 hypothetical protein EDD90_3291 [Streptomyces sp. Ag109_O5-1]
MTHRPYPNLDRARHQLDRHRVSASIPSYSAEQFARGLATLRAAGWTAQELAEKWRAGLRPRSVGSEETTT